MKKILSLLLCLAMLLTLGLTAMGQAEGDGGELRVSLCIAETLGDLGFYDSANEGLKRLEADYGVIGSTDFPSTPTLMRCKPVYTMLPGWKCDVRGVTEWDKLPENCKNYITFIEKELQVPIHMISTGPKREEMLYR